MVDFNWANFGIQTNTLNNQLDLYNSLGATDQTGARSPAWRIWPCLVVRARPDL